MFVVLLAGFLLVSASSAVDLEVNSVDVTDDVSIQQNVIGLDDVDVKAGNTGANNDISNLKEDNYKNFTELNQIISGASSGDEINLDSNYKYTEGDSAFINGIIIDKQIVINGNGYSIDGSNLARVFNVTTANVTIKNLHFTNSSCSYYGGAVYWSGEYGSIMNCSFLNCSANEYGGAVYWSGEYGSIMNCSFLNCSANEYGGAVCWYDCVNGSVMNCSFVGCSASEGGAVCWYDCVNGSVMNCSFLNCSVNKSGSAIECYGGVNGSVMNCSFLNCSSTKGYGGAIYWSGEYGSIMNCSFLNCSAKVDSGAIEWSGNFGSIMNCSFLNCSSTKGYGGAIEWPGVNGSVMNCSFLNCSSTKGYGGAIEWPGVNGSVMNCSFLNCSATNGYGGAICWYGSFGSVMNCSFLNCSAYDGGAIFWYGKLGSVNYCIFENNNASLGKSIYVDNVNVNVNVDFNFFGFQNNVTKFPSNLIYSATQNNWVVLNITNSSGYYVVKFVLNNGSSLDESMPDYDAVLSENGDVRDIVVKDNVWSGQIFKSGDVTANVNSPVTGTLLASLELEVTLKEVKIILPEGPVFVVGAGENYTVVIKSGGEAIGASFTVVLELVNGDNRKNYTLTTDDAGSVSLPIYLGYAKVYTFNIYFDAQGDYLANTASQEIIVVPLNSSLITDYVDDKMDSTVYSGDYWTAKLVDNKGNAIVNTSVEVHFKKAGADEKVYIVKSDVNGNVKLQLNLGYTGDYIIYAKFKGTSKYASSESHNITVTINKADVKLVTNYTDNTLFTTSNSGDQFKIQVLTLNDKVVKGVKLKINFTNSNGDGNVYTVTVKDDGFAYLTLNLSYVGKYFATVFFEGDSNYNPSQDSSITSIIVEKID